MKDNVEIEAKDLVFSAQKFIQSTIEVDAVTVAPVKTHRTLPTSHLLEFD